MKLTRLSVALLAPAALIITACEPPPATSPEACRGTLGAVTVEKVIVPQGATCTLEGTRVRSDVLVRGDATVIARGARIGGNVQAENHREVRIGRSSTVGGSIQVKQGQAASVAQTTVTGDIQLDANRGAQRVEDNRVDGNIQIVGNRTPSATVVRINRVGGNLQCKENVPAPTGGGNVVQGSKEDQCRRL